MRKTFAALAGITFGLLAAGLAIAARNSTGTYTLVAGNPVVTGTTITSTWANNTLTDLQTEMTDSLSRSGKGGMLAALKSIDGTAAAPVYSFTSDPDTGIYRVGANNPALTAGGVQSQAWTATGTTVPGTLGVTGNATVGGTLGVTGASTLASVGVTGNATVGGTLGVTGATTVPTPTLAGHAATKGYVDAVAPRAWFLATVGNIGGGVVTIDASHNIATLTYTASLLEGTFTDALSSANCAVICTTRPYATGGYGTPAIVAGTCSSTSAFWVRGHSTLAANTALAFDTSAAVPAHVSCVFYAQ